LKKYKREKIKKYKNHKKMTRLRKMRGMRGMIKTKRIGKYLPLNKKINTMNKFILERLLNTWRVMVKLGMENNFKVISRL
jgi:hypothetical protein